MSRGINSCNSQGDDRGLCDLGHSAIVRQYLLWVLFEQYPEPEASASLLQEPGQSPWANIGPPQRTHMAEIFSIVAQGTMVVFP
jgi:hypothetical protein